MTEADQAPGATDWVAKGRADATIATRAIVRRMFASDPPMAGHVCAKAIVHAYARDISVAGQGIARVRPSDGRLRLVSQLMLDANNEAWFTASLHAAPDFMQQYQVGFIAALDEEIVQWAAQPVRWPAHPDLLAEEEPWSLALAMGDGLAPK